MKKRNIIEAQIEQLLGKVAWTHKIQEKQADIYREYGNIAEFSKIVLSAITSSGIMVIAFGVESFWFKIITAIIALLNTAITLYLKKYNYTELEKIHKSSAVEWLGLREDYISLIADIRADIITDDELVERRDLLLENFKELSRTSPNTTSKAYSKASAALKINMDDLISKEEINQFLPIELRREENGIIK